MYKHLKFSPIIHLNFERSAVLILSAAKSDSDLLAVAIYARERVNPYLFQYAFSVALLHRPDTHDLELPSMVHTFPEKFFDSKIMGKARKYAAIVPEHKRVWQSVFSLSIYNSFIRIV